MFLTCWSPIELEPEGELLLHFARNLAGDADATGFGDLLKPRRDVHTFAVSVLAVDNHFAQIDTYPNLDVLVFGDISIAFG